MRIRPIALTLATIIAGLLFFGPLIIAGMMPVVGMFVPYSVLYWMFVAWGVVALIAIGNGLWHHRGPEP